MISLLVLGFLVGALARWAVPGPDPMAWWLTMGIGAVGSFIGYGIGAALIGSGADPYTIAWPVFLAAVLSSVLLIILYRRVVQKRPITGPEAQRFPARGPGVTRARRRLGVDAEAAPGRSKEVMEQLKKLGELRDAGVLTQEELEAKEAELRERSSR